jgi:DNA-binding MarR family transcriptional regulator
MSTTPQTLATDLRVLLGQLNRRLREQTHPHDLTASQKSTLLRLERDGPATTSTLARAEGVRPQSMGATVATLESLGMIAGAPDPTDGRQTILSLTPAFREIIATSRAAKEDWLLRAIHTHLSEAEQAELTHALDLIKRLANS